MGKIIFIKEGGKISVSQFSFEFGHKKNLYSYTSNYIQLDPSVKKVIFKNCEFKNNIPIRAEKDQDVHFENCHFYSVILKVSNANSVFLNSLFDFTDIMIKNCNSLSMKLFPNTYIEGLAVEAGKTSMTGNVEYPSDVFVRNCRLYGDYVAIKNLYFKKNLYCSIHVDTVDIQNSMLSESGPIHNGVEIVNNQLIVDENTVFKGDFISFYTPKNQATCEQVARYQNMVTGKDLLDKKKQDLYSLLSVLKGVVQKTATIHQEQSNEFSRKLDTKISEKQQILDEQIEKLQKQKAALELHAQEEKEKKKEILGKRKIKEIPYQN